jgi:hypothetical protein
MGAATSDRVNFRRRTAVTVVLGVVVLSVAFSSSAAWRPASRPLTARFDRVVLFGLPHVSLDDLQHGHTPNIDRLLATSASAAMTARTAAAHPSTAEGYISIGAGARLFGRTGAGLVLPSDAPFEGGTAAQAMLRRVGVEPGHGLAVLNGPSVVRANTGKHLPSVPGALGQALHDVGKRTAAVGNGDSPGSRDALAPAISRPAALAVMDEDMTVDAGAVSRADLLRSDPNAPYGVRADPARTLAAVTAAVQTSDVIAVDPGDLDRAASIRRVSLDRAADRQWNAALRRTDALLGAVLRRAPARTLVLVVPPDPPSNGWHLVPMLAAGDGIGASFLESPSTKRLGVVTITDVGPTVLGALGVPVPDGMIGHALRLHAGHPDLGDMRVIDRDAAYREQTGYPISVTFIVLQAVLYLLTMGIFGRRGGVGRMAPALRFVMLAIAAFPLSSFLIRAVPDVPRLGGAGVLVMLAIDVAVVLLASRARRHPLSPLSWILGTTAAVIAVDTATGVHLQTSSLLGYSLHNAARFYGIGNAAFAVLAVCSLLWAAIYVHFAPSRRDAMVIAAVVLAIVVAVDGAPSLGDDVGGILTLVPVFGLTFYVMTRRRLTWRAVLGAGALALVVVVGATAFDLLRPPEARTHLGRLASSIGDHGDSVFLTTIARKLAVNVHVLTSSIWTWMLPIIALITLYLLVLERRWNVLLPAGSALRAGAVGALAAGLLGFALNDSGVIVTALVFVYIGPFLTLLALDHEHRDGTTRPADSGPVPIPTG